MSHLNVPELLHPVLDQIDYDTCRQDLKVADLIRAGQFPDSVIVGLDGHWHNPLQFTIGRTAIWKCSASTPGWKGPSLNGLCGWQIADRTPDGMRNHRGFSADLEETILHVLAEQETATNDR